MQKQRKFSVGKPSLIKAYGLWWVRDAVKWGTKGKLPGVRMSYKGTQDGPRSALREVDAWNQRGVYALYSDARLTYVGLADSEKGLGDRLYAHHTKPRLAMRWDSFSWFGINGFTADGRTGSVTSIEATSRQLIRALEVILILAAEPVMNRATGKFEGGERINQIATVKQPTNEELLEMLVEIKKAIKR